MRYRGGDPATQQGRARLGAYYFDGWSGPLTNFHFAGMVSGAYADRQPLTGWQDAAACVVEQQLATARAFGLDFFVFDWYFGPSAMSNGENLNSALEITRQLPDRHGMQYAILYVDADGFIAAPADWPSVIAAWVSYFEDPAYLRVGGKPVVFVIDSPALHTVFGSSDAVRAAFTALRTAAQARGLPGVAIVAGWGPPYIDDSTTSEQRISDDHVLEGYDAISMYNYPGTPGPEKIQRPFSALSDAAHWIWQESAAFSPLPVIPVAMAGWDSRPWNSESVVWYTRTPQDTATLVGDAIDWAEAHPRLRLEPAPAPPLVVIEAWNELGEGSYILPTVGDGRSYGDALATTLTAPATTARAALTLDATAHGVLTDDTGAPIVGAPVAVTATALDGSGAYARFALDDLVPAAAARALVGFRVNTELQPGQAAGASDFAFYQGSFKQPDGAERVPDSDFAAGGASWGVGDAAQLVARDRGSGKMVRVQATATQTAELTSSSFEVTPASPFTFTVSARVAPSAAGTGYFAAIFLSGSGQEIGRLWIPLAAGRATVGTASTGAAGAYQVSLGSFAGAHVQLDADYAGDVAHWPAWARATP